MMGNVQAAFRPNIDQIIREKGFNNICSHDILDTKYYIKKLGKNSKFMEIFVQK
jgi:hypothetical protein